MSCPEKLAIPRTVGELGLKEVDGSYMKSGRYSLHFYK